MNEKVFCIGLGRSGTTTFGQCMQLLGYTHLGWVGGDNGFRADLRLLSMIDYSAFIREIDKFGSYDDYPFPLIYRQIIETYPNAKFILTTRISVEKWVESVISEFNRKNCSNGDDLWLEGELSSHDRRFKLEQRYYNHINQVKTFFHGKDNFLEVCWEKNSRWDELCHFLKIEIPVHPFPHANQSHLHNPIQLSEKMLDRRQYTKLFHYLNDKQDRELTLHIQKILVQKINKNPTLLYSRTTMSSDKKKSHLIKLKIEEFFLYAQNTIISRFEKLVSFIKKNSLMVNYQDFLQKFRRKEKATCYRYRLAICAIFRDEGKYLHEWLMFHHGVGVEHFYLYNDQSKDDYKSILKPWIEMGIVTLTNWPKHNLVAAYNHCLKKNRQKVEWIAFLDLDEFLFSPTGQKLPDVLVNYSETAVFVFWALFGSSGHASPPGDSVIESYTKHQDLDSAVNDSFDHGIPGTNNHVTAWSRDGKSIARTNKVKVMQNHKPETVFEGRIVDENHHEIPLSAIERRTSKHSFSYSILRINHYWSKSSEELIRRSQRGDVFDRSRPSKNLSRIREREGYLNEKDDDAIIAIWDKIKATHPLSDMKNKCENR